MSDQEQLDQEFKSRLEWQLRSELRREELREAGVRRPRWKSVLVALLALMTGFAVATAAQQYQDRERHILMVARMEATVELTRARQELASLFFADLLEQAEAGAVGAETVAMTRYEMSQLKRQLTRAELDLEETRLSGQPPSDELAAPLVAGRDFVAERLRLELDSLELRQTLFEAELDRLSSGSGEVDSNTRRMYEVESEKLAAEISAMRNQLRLREDFLAGRATIPQMALSVEQLEVRKAVEEARTRVQAAEEYLEQAEAEFRAGRMDELDLHHHRFALKEAQINERLAVLELSLLEKRLAQ